MKGSGYINKESGLTSTKKGGKNESSESPLVCGS